MFSALCCTRVCVCVCAYEIYYARFYIRTDFDSMLLKEQCPNHSVIVSVDVANRTTLRFYCPAIYILFDAVLCASMCLCLCMPVLCVSAKQNPIAIIVPVFISFRTLFVYVLACVRRMS